MNCPNCGGTVPPNVNRCAKCGSYIEQAVAAPAATFSAPPPPISSGIPPMPATAPKSKLVAGLLGIFLGSLGVHRFYLGNIGIGVAQLLITLIGGGATCGILAIPVWIWGLTEGILILSGVIKTDSEGHPLV